MIAPSQAGTSDQGICGRQQAHQHPDCVPRQALSLGSCMGAEVTVLPSRTTALIWYRFDQRLEEGCGGMHLALV